MNGSINLFEKFEKTSADSLFVLLNGAPVKMTAREIFDARRYTSLKAVSYVSSPRFFAETVKNFESVIFILGINNVDNLNKFSDGVSAMFSTERIKFFNELPDDTKNLVIQNNIQIRYGKSGVMIHDKIYLLANETTDDYRVAIGSANLSADAFNPDNYNFENVRVDDSKDLYQIYSERFNYLLKQTSDYIPERCRRSFRDKKVILAVTPETNLNLLLDEIQSSNVALKISPEQLDAINQRPDLLAAEVEEAQTTKKIIDVIIDKKASDGSVKFKPFDYILSIKNTLSDILHKSARRKNADSDFREFLLASGNYSLYKRISAKSDETELYSKPAEAGKIRATLEKINLFTQAYYDFAVTPNLVIPAKIYELILYAFTAPFIWKIRHKSSLDYDKSCVADIPRFCILSGTRESGKTTALRFAAMPLGQHGRQVYDYSRELDTADVVHSLLIENNLMPIFADELSLNFFKRSNSPRKGEEMIKSLANEVSDEPSGTLIGTTNLPEFSTSGQVIRRIYYLEVSSKFDSKRKKESADYLRKIHDNLSDELFSDFTFQFARAIRDGEKIYELDDFLSLTRKIFLLYYDKCGVEVPVYFPRETFSDYESRKVDTWRNFFDANRKSFRIRGDMIQVNIDEIFRNSGNVKAQKDRLVNFLDETCIASDFGVGVHWFLKKDEFYRFIGYEPPLLECAKNFFS